MKITNQNLDDYAADMLSAMTEYFNSTNIFKKKFEQGKESRSTESINYCLEKFLAAEFDCETKGDRGLGRLTEHCPRLAAYFRGAFSKLNLEKLKELDALITILIIKCYLFHVFAADKSIVSSNIKTGEQLFEKWIPRIYTFDLGSMSENIGKLLTALILKDYENIKNFFAENGMRAGFLKEDKIDEILYGYLAAGIVLRMAEEK